MQDKIECGVLDEYGAPSRASAYPLEAEGVYPPPNSLLDITNIRGLLYRQRYVLVGVTAAVLLVGFVITLLMRPQYEAVATVQIDPVRTNIVEGQDVSPVIGANEIDRYMKTQGSVIKSRKLAFRVVDALNLAARDDLLHLKADSRPAGISDKQWLEQRRDMAASMIQGSVRVDIPIDNRVIQIAFRSPDPMFAAQIANGYADNYVLEDTRRSLETNAYALNYLKDQIQQVRDKLQVAEGTANAYAKANGIVGPSLLQSSTGDSKDQSGAAPTITAANLASINETYTDARAKRIEAEQRWRAIANLSPMQLPEVQTNSAIQGLVSERSKAAAELSELRQRYGDSFPRIQELKAQIASLEGQVNRSATDIKNAIRDAYEVALRQEQGLSTELNKVSGDTLDEQDRRSQYNLLDREAGALRTQLAALLDRYNQISAAANINSGNVSKLDAATVPGGPVSPNLSRNLVIALVFGIALAVAVAILREAFDDRIRSTEDVERKLGLPLLGFTPDVPTEDIEAEAANPFSTLMEAYSSIRTSVDFAVPGNNRVLQVTSSQPAEGKSLTAAVLARKYAQLGRKTLLVDADLRKPSLARLFNAKRTDIGFAEVLLGDVDFHAALLKDTPENLDVLPVGAIPANPVDILSSQALEDFVDRVRKQYSLVIFDTPPTMGLADAPLLARIVDATVFIVEANRAHYGQAKTAIRRLRGATSHVAGVVLTKYRAADAGMAYDYQYQYYAYGNKAKG